MPGKVDKFVSGATALLLAIGAAGCQSESADVGHSRETQLINGIRGTFRGVGLGDSEAQVLNRLGKPARRGFRGPDPWRGRPVHEQPTNCPHSPGAQFDLLTYDTASFRVARNGRVCSVVVIQDGAATLNGVAIGDSLDEAKTKYPDAYCSEANDIRFDPPGRFPYCADRLGHARNVWFGGDPIDTIDLELKGVFPPKI